MTAKEYLWSLRMLDKRIDAKLEQAMRLRAQTECMTSTLDPNRGSGRTVRDASSAIDRLVDLEREIDACIDRLVEQRRETMQELGAMQNKTEALVLELRHINGKSWDAIAQQLSYDRVTVWRVHGHALNNFHGHERCNTMQHSDVL